MKGIGFSSELETQSEFRNPKSEIPITYADVSKARRLLDYAPQVSVEEGVILFWKWYSCRPPRSLETSEVLPRC